MGRCWVPNLVPRDVEVSQKHRGATVQRQAGAVWPVPADGDPAGPSGTGVADPLGEPFRERWVRG